MPVPKPVILDEKLLAERLAAFKPEPLVKARENPLPKDELEIPAIIEDENIIDLAKTNFLNVLNNEDIKKSSENIIRKYGVGTCGPRAFYGTTDVHLELEERIAEFLGMEEAIVYSYGFVAISSSIAAYCKKSDVVFTDINCNMAIRQGLQMARSKVIYFDHQNPESFANVVQKFTESEKGKKKVARKFLIAEGISWHTGKMLPLPEFLKTAEENKIRVFLEESYSVGVLGEKGQGLMEYFNIDPCRLDMIIATLEAAIGSIGGFCAGSQMTIEHQRLSGSGYIFSASLPTYLVKAGIESIELLEKNKPHHKLRKLNQKFHDMLLDIGYEVHSDLMAPFKIFSVKEKDEDVRKKREREIINFCKENGVHIIWNEVGLLANLNVVLFDDRKRYEKVEKVLRDAFKIVS